MNETLPPLPAWQARSFIAGILLLITLVARLFHFDLAAYLADAGWGKSLEDVVTTIEAVIPIFLAAWMYVERMAPKFRLVFGSVPK